MTKQPLWITSASEELCAAINRHKERVWLPANIAEIIAKYAIQEMPELPLTLRTHPAFVAAFERWIAYRKWKNGNRKLSPETIKAQVSKCEKWGPEKSILSIDQSIDNGWTGLFEVKELAKPVLAFRPAVPMGDK